MRHVRYFSCKDLLPSNSHLQARQPLLGARAIAIGGGERAAEAGDRLTGLAQPLVNRAKRQQRVDPLVAQLGAAALDIYGVAEERAVIHIISAIQLQRLSQ